MLQLHGYMTDYRKTQKARKQKDLKDVLYVIFVGLICIGLGNRVDSLIKEIHFPPLVKAQVITLPAPTAQPVVDKRVTNLQEFLHLKKSPLEPYADLIVSQADTYDIGWTTITAISGIESGYGLTSPLSSFNAWGLGGTHLIYFHSWSEGIKYVSSLLGNQYKWNSNKGMQLKYCPDSECSKTWASDVTYSSNQILGGSK